jgi:hypothetical protein
MAKSLRSKIKRHFRTVAGKIVKSTREQEVYHERKVAHLESILNAPRPERPENALTGDEVVAKTGGGDEEMGVMEDVVGTTKNPAKIAKRLAAARRAKLKGLHQSEKPKKKANPLGGTNQFHKKKSKRRR